MKTYIYDGSFEGLLTVIYEIFKNKEWEVIVSKTKNILLNFQKIETDYDKYNKVLTSIKKNLSADILKNILYTFLSENENRERYILNYLRFAFEKGRAVDLYISDEKVMPIHKFLKKVGFEIQRLKGLIRFRELKDGTFYSLIEPDYDILVLLASHFKNRFEDQNWVIHDIKREKALIYMNKNLELLEIKANTALLDLKNTEFLSNKEKDYQIMWKGYFESITIKERINKKLQMNYMPKRYWKYLTEI